MTTRKQGGEGPRPRIKSSHEKVLEPGHTKPRTKSPRPRGASRAAGAASTVRERPRGVKKTRPAAEPSSHDADFAAAEDRAGGWSIASESARETATAIAVAAIDKKAVGLEILDVAGKVDYADFLVIMTGRSDRHAHALAQGIEEALRRKGVRPIAVEGLPHGAWVLMDFGDVVVHVFQDESRQVYDIEGLWLDARRLPVPVVSAPGSPE